MRHPSRLWGRRAAALLAGIGLCAGSAQATLFSFLLENDVVNGSDRHYTNGVRLGFLLEPQEVPDWIAEPANILPFINADSDLFLDLALGHALFTPADLLLSFPDPTDRPYAAWGFLEAGLVAENGKQLDTYRFSFGWVGPAMQGEDIQDIVHNNLVGGDDPQGWDFELQNEPTFQFSYLKQWRAIWAGEFSGLEIDVTPHLGGAAGTVVVQAEAGVTVRLGQQLLLDHGAPRVLPSFGGTGYFAPRQGFGWFVHGGLSGRAVAHNIFLDGGTFRSGNRSVDREPLVGDGTFGVALFFRGYSLNYTHVIRSREFESQGSVDQFGSFSFAVGF
ncbi:MAG: lipid A deacylase LpxR family protein [Opitutales bacterium]